MSTKSDQFVIHQKFFTNDNLYLSTRKKEIISTIAEIFYKITNNKLKFISVEEENLKDYVTSKKQKNDDPNFTLMKNNYIFIEDIMGLKKEKDKNEEDKTAEDKKEENKTEEDKKEEDKKEEDKTEEDKNEEQNTISEENQLLKDKNLDKNLTNIDKKENIGLKFDTSSNPFTGALIGGAAAAGAGAAAVGGSIAACLAFDSVFLMSLATGEIFMAGWACVGGVLLGGLGLIIAIPTLLGFGAYKIYKLNKEKKFKQFYENFDDEKKKVERDIRNDVIIKIDKYFNKALLTNDNSFKLKIDDIKNWVNDIIKILINEDNIKIESSLELIKNNKSIPLETQKNLLLKKLYKESELVIKNFVKIRQEIMKVILQSTNKDLIKSFDEGIPFFKEFIKACGPQQISKENEKKIDNYLEKIISDLKKILQNNFNIRVKEFDKKTFKNSFSGYLREKYVEKKENNKNENIEEKDFIEDCQDFIIDPIANNSKNWGILSFYLFFIIIIQNIGVKLKEENFNNNKIKIDNIK